jgi:hypothetical protein
VVKKRCFPEYFEEKMGDPNLRLVAGYQALMRETAQLTILENVLL